MMELVIFLAHRTICHEKGLKINKKQLSQLLGVPVIEIEAVDGTGAKTLKLLLMYSNHLILL